MTKMVKQINHGVLALLTQADFEILQASTSVDEATAKGVKWFVFISMERAKRSPDLMARVTGAIEDWDRIAHRFEVVEHNFNVVMSNGPLYWDAESRWVHTWASLLSLAVQPREVRS